MTADLITIMFLVAIWAAIITSVVQAVRRFTRQWNAEMREHDRLRREMAAIAERPFLPEPLPNGGLVAMRKHRDGMRDADPVA